MSSFKPTSAADLSAPIAEFVQAVNAGDVRAMLALFAEDALVNDELVAYWGKERVREWAERDIFGKKLMVEVSTSRTHYDQVILSARICGEFDSRGLPDPLILAFHFSLAQGRIVQLIILPEPPDL